MTLRLASIIATFVTAASLLGQETEVRQDIVDHITEDGVNTIVQPAALARLLKAVRNFQAENPAAAEEAAAETTEQRAGASARSERIAGFRVQVLSDNGPRAKAEARAKGRNISERFPHYAVYVTYTSPYWRLRVGDFRTRREAEEAAEEIGQAFPSYKKEVRIVNDRIKFTPASD